MNEQVAEAVVAGKLDEAKLLAERMKPAHGVLPDATTLHILVDAFVREGRVGDAQACLEQFTTMLAIAPAIESLEAIAAEMVRSGPGEAAAAAITAMRQKYAFAPSGTLLQDATEKLMKERKHVLAAEFLARESGPSTVADTALCERLTIALLDCKALSKAKEFVIRCPGRPSDRMVASLVSHLSSFGRLDEAAQLAAQVWAKYRSAADRHTLNRLVQAYLAKEKFDHAVRLVKGMKQFYGVQPESYACNVIIHAFVKARRVEDAQKVLDMMPELAIQPTCITLSSLIAGYAKGGQVEKAKAMIESMESVWGVRPEIVTHNSIISALCQGNRVEEALQYLRTIKAPLGVRTFGPLIRSAVKRNDIGRMREYWAMMAREGVMADTFLWNGRLDIEASHGDEDSFEDAYDQMKRSGVATNAITMRTVSSAREKFRHQPRREEPSRSHAPRGAEYRQRSDDYPSRSYERSERDYRGYEAPPAAREPYRPHEEAWREGGPRDARPDADRRYSSAYDRREYDDREYDSRRAPAPAPRYPTDARAAQPPSHYAAERPVEDYATRYPRARDAHEQLPPPPRKTKPQHRTPLYAGEASHAGRYEPYPSPRKERDHRPRVYS